MASIPDECPVVPTPTASEAVPCNITVNSSTAPEGRQKVQSSVTQFAVLLLTLKRVYSLSESCVKALLLLMAVLIRIVGTAFGAKNDDIKSFLAIFPTSEYSLRSIADINKGYRFKQYICFPTCYKIYPELRDWTIYSHSKPDDFLCDNVAYPRHPQTSRRNKCGRILLKRFNTGLSTFLRPVKVYPYRSLVSSLTDLLTRPDILQLCNQWALRTSTNSHAMIDIYDGQVWKDNLVINHRPFLSQPNNLALSLNVDWFQPFQRTSYSVGVVYIVILNLPREMRYLPRNVIIVGIIPGPREPKQTINTILEPLVKDLLALWDGIFMSIPSLMAPVRIRSILLCISCDIPACRKVCGFLGHNAHLACSKCMKFFNGNVQEGFDYSGFDTVSWSARDQVRHRINAKATKVALTKTQRAELESKYGVRYSVLLELPYFNIIRQHIIDPMHNLFLGLAKHAISVWTKKAILTPQAMVEIQEVVDSIEVPSKVGRVPSKIASGFSDFTADQWKNWIMVYSLVALKDRLPDHDFTCWAKFVSACRLICAPVITSDAILQAHALIVEYCQKFEHLYGKEACTVNMHLACHMSDCIRDFGPLHTFWCFGFERMNGQLGALPTNNRSIEVQFMRQFVDGMHLNSTSHVYEWSPEVQEILQLLTQRSKRGTLSFIDSTENTAYPTPIHTVSSIDSTDDLRHIIKETVGHEKLAGSKCTTALTAVEHANLTVLCQTIFSDTFDRLDFVCDVYTQMLLGGQSYGSSTSRLLRSAYVKGYYTMDTSGRMLLATGVGIVTKYFNVTIHLKVNENTLPTKLSFALIDWLEEHQERFNSYPAPIEVWSPSSGVRTFIPVASILTCVAAMKTNNSETLVIIPL